MSEFRLKYGQVSPEGIAKLRELEHWVNPDSGLEHSLRELVKLRASLLNGCEACVRVHTAELRERWRERGADRRRGGVAQVPGLYKA